MAFTRAVRAGAPVVVGIVSHSGNGKTLSALKIARGLVGPKGKIAVIDSEAGRALHYSDVTEYDCDQIVAPYSPGRYVEKIREAIALGYDVIILDQASFEWNGTGGVLEIAEATGKQGLLKWMGAKTAHRKFLNALLECPVHIIITLRAKWEMIEGPDPERPGKKTIIRGGLVAQQHEDFLYEMTVSMILDCEDGNGKPLLGVPRLVKCPAALLPAFPEGEQLSERTGAMIAEWVKGGAPVDHAFETLKGEARSMALEGTVKLRAWLKERLAMVKAGTLPPALWEKLKPLMGTELESAARAADAMAAMREPAEPVGDSSVLTDGKKET